LAHEAGDELRERRRQARDCPGGSVLEASKKERLGTDEHVEPLDQIRLDLLEGLIRDLEAGQVRCELAQALDDRKRDRISGACTKLVEVEGQRAARLGGGGEMPNQRLFVER